MASFFFFEKLLLMGTRMHSIIFCCVRIIIIIIIIIIQFYIKIIQSIEIESTEKSCSFSKIYEFQLEWLASEEAHKLCMALDFIRQVATPGNVDSNALLPFAKSHPVLRWNSLVCRRLYQLQSHNPLANDLGFSFTDSHLKFHNMYGPF